MKLKKRQIEQISKKVTEAIIKNRQNRRETKMEVVSDNNFRELLFSECDDEYKLKTRDMIYRLLQFRDELRISSSPNKISIYKEDIKSLKSKSKASTTNQFSASVDEYYSLELEIIKNVGYILNYNNKKMAYIDEKLYDDVLEKTKTVFKEINDKNFQEMHSLIMKDSGIARESNLDLLLLR